MPGLTIILLLHRFLSRLFPSMMAKNPRFIHKKARQTYQTSKGEHKARFEFPDDKVPWSVLFPEYEPVYFSDPYIEGKPWADNDIHATPKPKFNAVDGKVDRTSFEGPYDLDLKTGAPLNPFGRTGMYGRALLGRWGPNHAADPVVTRWKRDKEGKLVFSVATQKPILQFVSIRRRDTGEWGIPGGMVDPGEHVTVTLRREFSEEALAGFNHEERSHIAGLVAQFFSRGCKIYEGYVDDPRNTDNAWMETTVFNFHDDDGAVVAKFPLAAGDDAGAVTWTDINKDLRLYASHADFVRFVAEKHGAHW